MLRVLACGRKNIIKNLHHEIKSVIKTHNRISAETVINRGIASRRWDTVRLYLIFIHYKGVQTFHSYNGIKQCNARRAL